MGEFYSVNCKCGYKDEVSMGSGWLPRVRKVYPRETLFVRLVQFFTGKDALAFEEEYIYWGAPFYCAGCSSMVEVNTHAVDICCPNCHSRDIVDYDDSSLYKKSSEINAGYPFVTTWKNADFFCPKCRCFSMTFNLDGYFD